MKIYHATKPKIADDILENGFKGNRVWDYDNVVFFADKPLEGFGSWIDGDAGVVVNVPKNQLQKGYYQETKQDKENYNANCYMFDADFINQFPREII